MPKHVTMLKLLTATTASILLAAPAIAVVDPKVAAQCKDARDFVGCVKAFTSPAAITTDDGLEGLRNAMKQVAARLSAGMNYRDSTLTFQPVVDALAIVENSHPDSLSVQSARKASRLFDAMQDAWDLQIKNSPNDWSNYLGDKRMVSCNSITQAANRFNNIYGSEVISYQIKKGIINIGLCSIPVGQMPLDYMYPVVIRVLNEGSISPAEIASREAQAKEADAKRKREEEMARMEPWEKHLEENPKLKEWVNANPKVAEIEKAKFLGRQSKPEAFTLPSGTNWKW